MNIKQLRADIMKLEETLRQTWPGSELEKDIRAKLTKALDRLDRQLRIENERTDKTHKLDQRKLFDS